MVKGRFWHRVVAAREREGTTYIVYAIDIGISLHSGVAQLRGRGSGMMSYLDLHQGLHQRVCRRHGGSNIRICLSFAVLFLSGSWSRDCSRPRNEPSMSMLDRQMDWYDLVIYLSSHVTLYFCPRPRILCAPRMQTQRRLQLTVLTRQPMSELSWNIKPIGGSKGRWTWIPRRGDILAPRQPHAQGDSAILASESVS